MRQRQFNCYYTNKIEIFKFSFIPTLNFSYVYYDTEKICHIREQDQILSNLEFVSPCIIILYIKMNVCMYICMYVLYTNSHFWTDLNQTLHTSPPWSGRDTRVCMSPKFLTSSTFWAPFSSGATAESLAQDGCQRDRFPRYPYIRDSSWCSCDVTDMTSQTSESSAAV